MRAIALPLLLLLGNVLHAEEAEESPRFPVEIQALLPNALLEEFRSELVEKLKDIRSNYPMVSANHGIEFLPNDSYRCRENQPAQESVFEVRFYATTNQDHTQTRLEAIYKACHRKIAREILTIEGNHLPSVNYSWVGDWMKGKVDFELANHELSRSYRFELAESSLLEIKREKVSTGVATRFTNNTQQLFEIRENLQESALEAAFSRTSNNKSFSVQIDRTSNPQFTGIEFRIRPDSRDRRSFKEWKDQLTEKILDPYWNQKPIKSLREKVLSGFPATKRVVSLARSQKFLDELQLILQNTRSGDPSQARDAATRLQKIILDIQSGDITVDDRRK